MIKLTKLEGPATLMEKADGWTQELLDAIAAQLSAEEIGKLKERYRHPEVRIQLEAETHQKCAYCESKMVAVAFSHIEHILPKDRHPELTFEWTNLTLACPKCNLRKANTEPSNTNFVHPYTDNPTARFSFAGPYIRWRMGDTAAHNMIKWLDLNRPELLEQRARIMDAIQRIFDVAAGLAVDLRADYVELATADYISPHAEFSGMARHLVAEFKADLNSEAEVL